MDSPYQVTLGDKDAQVTLTIPTPDRMVTLAEYLDRLVKPGLVALGYTQETVDQAIP